MNYILKILLLSSFLWTTYPAMLFSKSELVIYDYKESEPRHIDRNLAITLINSCPIKKIDKEGTVPTKNQIKLSLECKDVAIKAVPSSIEVNNPNCKGIVKLEAVAGSDVVCSQGNLIHWQMFFDEWSDGTVDRIGIGTVSKLWKDTWIKVEKYTDGNLNPEWSALQKQFSNILLKELVYVTYIQPTFSTSTQEGDKTAELPAFSLSPGSISHNVKWFITDDCGNEEYCQSKVDVLDDKAPELICKDINSAIVYTKTDMGEILARLSDSTSSDDCTIHDDLYYTFDGIHPLKNLLNIEHYFKKSAGKIQGIEATEKEFNNGDAQKWIPSLKSASKLLSNIHQKEIQINVWDHSWNTDYCISKIDIINMDEGVSLIGNISTEDNRVVSNVQVTAKINNPDSTMSTMTGLEGNYSFVVDYKEVEVSASKEGDDLNGVSTLDLVMIQRHILGLEAIKSPYKIIAADATNDGRVSASDITEIRKLVLGIITKFKYNKSWRFVVIDCYMDKEHPFPYIEKYMASVMSGNESGFVAVKTGDVNNTAKTNAFADNVTVRSNERVILSVENMKLNTGEYISIPISAKNYNNVIGFQYTMKIHDADFMGIQSGALEISEDNVGNSENGFITMSYSGTEGVTLSDGEILFTILIKAQKPTHISEVLSIGSDITHAESYNGDLQTGSISLEVRSAAEPKIILYPNEPNPFKISTTVRFAMPEAGLVTLSVYDLTGKLVALRKISSVKGINTEVFTKEQLGRSGVMFYTLESAGFTSARKMISID